MSAVMAASLSGVELKRRIVDFVRGASTEISTHDEQQLGTLAAELPPGTSVYVAHTPKASLEDVVRVAVKVQALGLPASPHIVARRVPSREALARALEQLRAGGVGQVLLVAGDLAEPAGPFTSTLDVLDSGCLEQAHMPLVGVAGHPEGNPAISPTALWQALARKQAWAAASGIKVHIVTQFTFDPQAISSFEHALGGHDIHLPVHVGIAGPTPLPKLIKFAMQCGVGASLRTVMKNMATMRKMVGLATSPDEMLVGLVRAGAGSGTTRLVRPHFFAFGGTVATAHWLRRVTEGRFELPEDGGKFQMS
jgi:methylenetetrahydrofolate reductase (NADH)